jgi:RHS repeat-associated protein
MALGCRGPVAVYTRKSSGTNEIHYLTRDHLGSIDSVSNGVGTVELRTGFGAFGQRRRDSGWSGDLTSGDWTGVASTSRRGYTFHEMLDNLELTHMNGRVYDQVTGRFLSPDPFVQAPGFTQSFNRYAYVFNNPLSYADPSGYAASNADGAADSAAAAWNPYTAAFQLFRLWRGFGNSAEEFRQHWKKQLDKLLPPFDPVVVPRTTNTNAGEPVQNDPAAGFKSPVGGEFQRPSFFDAYFERVGGALYGVADSFSAGIDLGLQAKASVTLPLNIKGEAGIGNHNWNLTLTGAGDLRGSIKSPIPHDLLYGEASLALGPIKLGGSTQHYRGSLVAQRSLRPCRGRIQRFCPSSSVEERCRKDWCPPANRSGCKSRVGFTQVFQRN